jgi:hypothetical protein
MNLWQEKGRKVRPIPRSRSSSPSSATSPTNGSMWPPSWTLKNEPKWFVYVAQLEKENDKDSPIHVADDQNAQRPISKDAAKAQRSGKRKTGEVVADGIVLLGENITKIIQVQQERENYSSFNMFWLIMVSFFFTFSCRIQQTTLLIFFYGCEAI